MSSLWIPAESEVARALRAPNLLTPANKHRGPLRINKCHPLARGLRHFVPFIPGQPITDLVSGSRRTNSGGSYVGDLYDLGASDTVDFTQGDLYMGSTEPHSWAMLIETDQAASANPGCWTIAQSLGSTALGPRCLLGSGVYGPMTVGMRDAVGATHYNYHWPNATFGTSITGLNFWGATNNGTSGSYAGVRVFKNELDAPADVGSSLTFVTATSLGRSNATKFLDGRFRYFVVWSRQLTPSEMHEFRRNPFALLEPANQTPFLVSVSAGGGVTGTGDLVGAGSEVVGTGTRTVTGAGALEGQGASVVGTGERTITGTGALIGQGSDVAGTGATGGVHTGTGDLIGAGSEVVGVGKRTITGTGALLAQGSAVVGVGERTIIGSGDLVGAGAEVSGSGAVGGITTGTGDLVGAGSEVVGTGLRTVTGSGALVAQGSAVTGTGERTVTGAGALVGSGSEIVGAGVGSDVTTGAGALVGQGSAVTGTGKRTITGVGDLVAAGSIIVGAGVRTITGSGALVGAGSEIVGTYVATIVEPSLFQTAADTIIDVFAAAHGQTITLALDSGTVTITGFMRKRPKDWDTPDGKMRGSGWQIVCKGWEISSSDLEGMSGKRATVDGDAYYIVSATPKTSGTLVLDVGYAN